MRNTVANIILLTKGIVSCKLLWIALVWKRMMWGYCVGSDECGFGWCIFGRQKRVYLMQWRFSHQGQGCQQRYWQITDPLGSVFPPDHSIFFILISCKMMNRLRINVHFVGLGLTITEFHCLPTSPSDFEVCHFSYDGKLLATGGHDKRVRKYSRVLSEMDRSIEAVCWIVLSNTIDCWLRDLLIGTYLFVDRTKDVWLVIIRRQYSGAPSHLDWSQSLRSTPSQLQMPASVQECPVLLLRQLIQLSEFGMLIMSVCSF